jgi:hypothetical protein
VAARGAWASAPVEPPQLACKYLEPFPISAIDALRFTFAPRSEPQTTRWPSPHHPPPGAGWASSYLFCPHLKQRALRRFIIRSASGSGSRLRGRPDQAIGGRFPQQLRASARRQRHPIVCLQRRVRARQRRAGRIPRNRKPVRQSVFGPGRSSRGRRRTARCGLSSEQLSTQQM